MIAEKRSVAFAIAQALGDVRQGDGYVSAGGALISWAQGHLVELSDPEEYTDMPWSAHKWTMEFLPIDPKSWRWCLSGAKGAVQRYRSLSELLRSDKVTELVNACDPDREGEAIFRRILMAAKISKPSLRLWVASLDEQAIRDAWKRMRPESDYDGLADAADARAKADWLVGMNASRAHTLAWHRSLSLGRVRTPTLNMVVQRDLAIESHKPTPFWRLIVPMDGWTLESGKIEDRAMARRILADAMGLPVEILEVRRRREHAKPP
ncbi:DNA topoisomerase, partial [Bifidobacterium adolescentis]